MDSWIGTGGWERLDGIGEHGTHHGCFTKRACRAQTQGPKSSEGPGGWMLRMGIKSVILPIVAKGQRDCTQGGAGTEMGIAPISCCGAFNTQVFQKGHNES